MEQLFYFAHDLHLAHAPWRTAIIVAAVALSITKPSVRDVSDFLTRLVPVKLKMSISIGDRSGEVQSIRAQAEEFPTHTPHSQANAQADSRHPRRNPPLPKSPRPPKKRGLRTEN